MTEEEYAEFLEHFGVKGMHWGVRRSDVKQSSEAIPSTKTSKGHELHFEPTKTPFVGNVLANVSSRIRDNINRSDSYNLKDASGKTIGDLSVYKSSDKSMDVTWVEVKDSERGKGYATAAMKSAIKLARKKRFERVTLEVPGSSPDALHIYEKLGFKKDGRDSGKKGDVWDGLTGMTLELDAKHVDGVDAVLAHFGVKGMKWGVRKALSTSDDRKIADSVNNQAKVGGVTSLSNEQISKAIARMNLEKQYVQAKGDASLKKSALKFIGKLLLDFGASYASSYIKHPGANAATGGNFAWAYAGAKTINGVVVRQRELGA